MEYPSLEFSRQQVNRAGDILRHHSAPAEGPLVLKDLEDYLWANGVLSNWRACHNYPINTFQATLRQRLKVIDLEATVAQRLKRFPSIEAKLLRFRKMELARMQDIGGLRAIVQSVAHVRKLDATYRAAKGTFAHELTQSKDYIQNPKPDGYRSIHLVYRYKNKKAPQYDGLHLELQIRSRLQHAWATAVETMGTFLGQALKSGQGESQWREFFAITGAAIAHRERTPPVPGYEKIGRIETCVMVADCESRLHVLQKLRGFSVAADKITTEKGSGTYHLIILNSSDKSVTIRPFASARLGEANEAYTEVEARARNGEPIEAVLVSAGPIEALKKAYPNYFLDTHGFIKEVQRYITLANVAPRTYKRRRVLIPFQKRPRSTVSK